jgi:thioredoxin reductase (NADPH)
MIFQRVPECTGEELTDNLLQQIKPFNVKFHLNERVEQLKKVENQMAC